MCVAVGKGDTHDLKLFQASKTKVHPETEVIADAEYQGLQEARLCAWIPHETTKLQPLIPDQKQENRFTSQRRLHVEHLILFLSALRKHI